MLMEVFISRLSERAGKALPPYDISAARHWKEGTERWWLLGKSMSSTLLAGATESYCSSLTKIARVTRPRLGSDKEGGAWESSSLWVREPSPSIPPSLHRRGTDGQVPRPDETGVLTRSYHSTTKTIPSGAMPQYHLRNSNTGTPSPQRAEVGFRALHFRPRWIDTFPGVYPPSR